MQRYPTSVLLVIMLLASLAGRCIAAIRLPSIISDNMVLQRDQPVPIWGWADKDEAVTVSIAGQQQTAKADTDGRWKVILAKLSVGKPLEMTIVGSSGSSITLKNILVGEVWICSGQSNMEMGLGATNDGKQAIAEADYPAIRFFAAEKTKAEKPAADVKGDWNICSPKTIGKGTWSGFSAVGYYFGRELHKELGVPVGLIGTYWTGTPAQFWTRREVLESDPMLKPLAKGQSSSLFNGMVAPLIPFGMRGVIWYQGEANANNPSLYRTLFPALIANWRADWGQGDFPFLFVQVSPYHFPPEKPKRNRNLSDLREAQRVTLAAVPNTGMAVTLDVTDITQGHPKNKLDVGRRLALWALAKTYGKDVVYSGPLYKSMAVEGSRIRLHFDHVDGGLVSRDGKPLSDFTIAAEDEKFEPATAEFDGDSVIVHSDSVAKPVAVRYGWRCDATPNLANKSGLPASSFRTDDWKNASED